MLAALLIFFDHSQRSIWLERSDLHRRLRDAPTLSPKSERQISELLTNFGRLHARGTGWRSQTARDRPAERGEFEEAVYVDIPQDPRIASRSACLQRLAPTEGGFGKIKLIDETR
ncbi:hypothetical protein [Rhodomicrobium vannielii]|uniref:hypothetical protein n=1 Tax=Rhodomicrobium vannielii TaxID=1069 RepID=UPI00059FF51E|nr:hypothetical protein [Rhodomicrobium vannielii]